MAITRSTSWIKFAAAGDSIPDKVRVVGFHFHTQGTASTTTGTVITVSDGQGTPVVMMTVPMLVQSAHEVNLAAPIWVDGLKLTTMPNGASMTIFLA